MNYNRNKGTFLAVIRLPQKGYMVSAIGGEQLAMKIFSPVSTCFFIDFLPFPYYLFFGNENYQKL